MPWANYSTPRILPSLFVKERESYLQVYLSNHYAEGDIVII